MTTRLPVKLKCPTCGYPADAMSAIGPEDAEPEPGAVTICIGCGQPALLEHDFIGLRQRLPTAAELAELRADSTVAQVLDAYQEAFDREPELQVAP